MSKNDKEKSKINLKNHILVDRGKKITNMSTINVVTPFTEDKEKKKKKEKPVEVTGPVPYDQMAKDAECYENYLKIIETYCILKNVSPERYEKAVKKIKKMIKYLREGKGDKVYDVDRYEEYMRRREGDSY